MTARQLLMNRGGVDIDGAQRQKMRPTVCAACGKGVTMAIWDKETEQLYCGRCIPPLPVPTKSPQAKATQESAYDELMMRLSLGPGEGRNE